YSSAIKAQKELEKEKAISHNKKITSPFRTSSLVKTSSDFPR
ncbi:29271_t:CDS:1, partial [Racocetra persica]